MGLNHDHGYERRLNVMKKRSKFIMSSRIIAVFMAVVMVGFGFAGCGKKKVTDTGASKKLSVVTTNYPSYDFAKKIAGDKADVTLLLPPGADAHSFEPKPGDIKKIAAADMVIGVGGVEDPWVKESVKQAWKKDDIKSGKKKALYMLDFFKKSKKDLIKGEHQLKHPFTGMDYVSYYKRIIEEEGAEAEIIFANNPKAILDYTENVLQCDIHTRERTKKLLKEIGRAHV